MTTKHMWVRLPLEVLQRKDVSLTATIVLSILIDVCGNYPDGSAELSLSALQERTGFGITAIKTALKQLQQLKLIAVTRTGRASIYTLTGAAEILPPKKRITTKRPTAEMDDDMRAYMKILNAPLPEPEPEPEPEQRKPTPEPEPEPEPEQRKPTPEEQARLDEEVRLFLESLSVI